MPDIVRVPDVVEFSVEEPLREPNDVDNNPGYVEKSHEEVVNHGFAKGICLRPKWKLHEKRSMAYWEYSTKSK